MLIVHAARRGDAAFIVGASLFSAPVFLLYLASTSPFPLGVLSGAWGWTFFGIAWGLAICGVAFTASGRVSHPVFSTGLYLLMGWLVVVAVDSLFTRVPVAGLLWMLEGGLSHTAGVVLFATDS